jgi:hypothetical protein
MMNVDHVYRGRFLRTCQKKKKGRSGVFTGPRIPQSGIPSFLESHLDILDRLLGISQECEDLEDLEDVEDVENVEDVEVSAA